jgi:hypothetical protein
MDESKRMIHKLMLQGKREILSKDTEIFVILGKGSIIENFL